MLQESIQTSHKNLPIRSNLSFCVFYTHKKTHKKSQHHYDLAEKEPSKNSFSTMTHLSSAKKNP